MRFCQALVSPSLSLYFSQKSVIEQVENKFARLTAQITIFDLQNHLNHQRQARTKNFLRIIWQYGKSSILIFFDDLKGKIDKPKEHFAAVIIYILEIIACLYMPC